MKNEILKFVIEGVEVETTAAISGQGSFCLRMTNPYFESYFVSPPVLVEYFRFQPIFDSKSTVAEKGLDHATPMATALYGGYLVVLEKFDLLEQKAEETKHHSYELRLYLEQELEKFNAFRRWWKKNFKSGGILIEEYKKTLIIIEARKKNVHKIYEAEKKKLIYAAFNELEPEINTTIEKDSDYSIASAVRTYFWGLVDRKTDELVKEIKLKQKKMLQRDVHLTEDRRWVKTSN